MADHGTSSSSNSSRRGSRAPPAAIDRISSLPDDVLVNILSFLPMKRAIQTSILSKRWRFLWSFNPNFDFLIDRNNPQGHERTCIGIINQCLRRVNRPTINRFLVKHLLVGDISPHVQTWIQIAVSKSVGQLILQIHTLKLYHLPQCLFFHTRLTELVLLTSIVLPPPEFNGFPRLKVLELCYVCIHDQTIETMLLKCPLLEKLSLDFCYDLKNLNICAVPSLKILKVSGGTSLKKILVNAPNLVFFKYMDYSGGVKICLENVPCLQEADVYVDKSLEPQILHEKIPFAMSLANVESLKVDYWFSQTITQVELPHIVFRNLRDFNWSCDLNYQHEILAFASFLGDCSSLQKLRIKIRDRGYKFDWPRYYETLIMQYPPSQEAVRIVNEEGLNLEHFDYELHHLKRIEIVGFRGTKNELELVRFLLVKSIVLELLLVKSVQGDEIENKEDYIPNWMLQNHTSSLPKSSTHAKIVVY